MFVYSVKSNHIKAFLLVAFVFVTAISLFVLSRETVEEVDKQGINTSAETHAERMSFISQFGWKVTEEPVEIKEVIIPEEFDDTYIAYNEIQKSQGFDLTEFAGKRAKRWTYVVKNYEGYESSECIHINLLVYDNKVIGGDVCSVELDGFMHSFSKT